MTDTSDVEILLSSPGPLHFSSQFWSVFHSRTGIRYARATTHQLRTHPEAIALFREMGSEWCSAYGRTLSIWTIPKVFEKYWAVENESGNENDADSDEVCVIRVDDACADLCVSAHVRLHAEYTALKETFKAYMDRVRQANVNVTNVKTSHETQGETVKAETETNNDGNGVHTYSYFGC